MGLVHGAQEPLGVTNGLVLYLDAANKRSYPGSGTTWFDRSGSNNGTLTNGPSFNSSNFGSIVFDGSNDYVTIPFSLSFPTGSSARTLCAFFKPTSLGVGGVIFGIGGNSTNGGRSSLWVGSDGNIGVECRNSGVFLSSLSDWGGLNTWNYLCAVYPSGSTTVGSFILYVNGSLKSSSAFNGATTFNTTNQSAIIATVPAAPGSNMFTGNIAQVSIYNRALTAAEIQQNFNALRGRFGI